MPVSRNRVGLIVVRVWIEGLLPTGLRAKITHVRDVDEADEESVYASTIDETVDIVRHRLEHFAQAADGDASVTEP